MEDLTFYNNSGKPIAYTEDGEHIYLFNGTPVAYFSDDSVYGFNGKHLGRFTDGWIRDNSGRCAFYTNETTGSGPLKPLKQLKPMKSLKSLKPMKSMRQMRPMKPMNSLSWSSLSSELFFHQ
jgi:hypothetical protein